jgi:glycosyltransferase involved in cell wall biosynthesis
VESISVAIITFNEEVNIGRCLASVQEIADDIVVVDSFSEDATKEICSSFGVRFIQKEWMGYVDTKNFALDQCRYPLILSLDADEVLSEELKKSILKVKTERKYDSYTFNRLTNYCGSWIRYCGWYPDKKLRLFDKTKGRWKGVDIHEYVAMEAGSTTKHLKGDLLHYSYYTINQHFRQALKFSEIAAVSFYKQGKKTNIAKIVFAPLFRFFRDYFLKMGVLDGFHGFVICAISAHAAFQKNILLKEEWQKNQK